MILSPKRLSFLITQLSMTFFGVRSETQRGRENEEVRKLGREEVEKGNPPRNFPIS
jgi:hypothetical protein